MTEVVKLSMVLGRLNACEQARLWVEGTGNKYFVQTWDQCTRGCWLLWLVARVAPPRVSVDLMAKLLERHLAEDLAVNPSAADVLLWIRKWIDEGTDAHELRDKLLFAEARWTPECGRSIKAASYLLQHVLDTEDGLYSYADRSADFRAADDASYFVEYLRKDEYTDPEDLEAEVADTIRSLINPAYVEQTILAWWSLRE